MAEARPSPGGARQNRRNFNLDALRAAAITGVVLAHATVMDPIHHGRAAVLTWLGQFGVDLFFVLSGWLIGGLFWKERAEFGRVRWGRFVLRRALRTVPPYLVMLPLAWFAVRHFSPERPPFSLRYLVFLQNYMAKIPYFSISWSLCVEEHFYLVLPALVLFALAARLPLSVFFAALLAVSPLCRIFFQPAQSFDDFNQGILSTHLRLEGLVLGFWGSYIHACLPAVWRKVAPWLRRLWIPALLAYAATPLLPTLTFYHWGPTLIAVSFAISVGNAAVADPWPLPKPAIVSRLATMSYSIYLTHALVIHVARRLTLPLGGRADVLYWPFVLVAMVSVGALFSRLVEAPSIRWRDRLAPARQQS
jgi:peptidoglycan/LPS O-acetylase OafA/YrhL